MPDQTPPAPPQALTAEDIRAAFLANTARHQPVQRPDSSERLHDGVGDLGREAHKQMAAEGRRDISVRWWSMMTMQMNGLTNKEIAAKLGMSEPTVSRVTCTRRYREAYKSRLDGLDEELYALKPRAIDAMARGLTSQNTDTALRAAGEFFKITGQGTYSKTAEAPSGVGAEALARQLLLASKQEVHVHVHQPEARSASDVPVVSTEARSASDSQGELPLE